ncbi:MAG: VTT domain-containing protein [Gammaproteobacteria bacterium]|nr:VTT domain-containing protein [Gammaproteobacteria bacterium]MCF6230002.1 VTT domain-containing protein [Gammaproteobacteria bacterium]
MTDLIHQLLSWVSANPHWAGLAVLLVACAESLAIVGWVVPGAVMMLGAGALIAAGAMGFWPTFLLAVAGAVLGDGLSYWLGYRYNEKIRQWWPFNRHPALLLRGEAFFSRHGGKSVFIARFVGPVRPVVPMMAGMMMMPAPHFFLANIFSALAWAPLYLLLGMAFGASLALAGEVAGRLAVLLGAALLAVWVIIKMVHVIYLFLKKRGQRWAEKCLSQGRIHPTGAWIVADLLDADKPVLGALLVWLAILLGGSGLFLWVSGNVMTGDSLVPAGESLYILLQSLRTPLGDQLMVIFSALGDGVMILTLVISVLLWMVWKRAWREALYWLAAVGFAALAVALFKYSYHFPRPVAMYSGANAYSFPSAHATLSIVVYGYLAMLAAQTLPDSRRWLPYAAAALLVAGIGFSRLYLGAHWLADVLGGIGLGAAWISLLAIARHYHLRRRGDVSGVPVVALLVFLMAGSWHVNAKMADDLVRYAVPQSIQLVAEDEWWRSAWRESPAFRIDLEGEQKQPLNIQWLGELTSLRQQLEAQGWYAPEPVTASGVLRWLLPHPQLVELPVLPQFHNGQQQALLLIRPNVSKHASTAPLWVLRLWPTTVQLEPGAKKLWFGTVTGLREQCLPLICFPRSTADYEPALVELEPLLSGKEWQRVDRISIKQSEQQPMDYSVLLIR